MRRRQFLGAATIAGAAATGGCFGDLAGGSASEPTDSEEPTPHDDPGATPSCDELQPHPLDMGSYRLHEAYGGFALDATRDGETVTVRLRNGTEEGLHTGNRWKYALQYLDDEWLHRLWVAENYGWTDEAIGHAPGEGFTWEFTLDREGLSQGPYRVCTAIRPGQYRFVYFGIVDDDDRDYALVAEFELPE